MNYYKATTKDYEYIQYLFNENNTEFMNSKSVSIKDIEIKAEKGTIFYIIENDNEKIGYFNIRLLGDTTASFGIIIDSKHQNQGYGQQAMKFMEHEAKKLGATKVKFNVYANNKKAIHVYKKFGCVEDHAEIVMIKKL